MLISKIISGGQTGVDRAALDFAIENGIPCGGRCPKGRLAEDGLIPKKYPLTETDSSEYYVRTLKNVEESDATLVILDNEPDEGTKLTVILCKELSKPYLIYDVSSETDTGIIRQWLTMNSIKVLNVAGPRESNSQGIYAKTYLLLSSVL